MSRRLLALLATIACGAAALGFGLRALAQSAPAGQPAAASAPPPAASATPPAAAPAVPASDGAAAPDDDPQLRQSADNNLSFPVDI